MCEENKSKLFLLAGPSGAGKSTLMNYLAKEYNLHSLVFLTTRQPRVDDDSYLFKYISIMEYESRQKNGQFVFSFGSHENRYAVNYDEFNDMIKSNKDMILTISYKNYYKILESNIDNLVDIQLIVLTMNDLYNGISERLLNRNSTMSSQEVRNRIKYAFQEHEQYFADISSKALCIIYTDNYTIEETQNIVSNIIYPKNKSLKLERK